MTDTSTLLTQHQHDTRQGNNKMTHPLSKELRQHKTHASKRVMQQQCD